MFKINNKDIKVGAVLESLLLALNIITACSSVVINFEKVNANWAELYFLYYIQIMNEWFNSFVVKDRI